MPPLRRTVPECPRFQWNPLFQTECAPHSPPRDACSIIGGGELRASRRSRRFSIGSKFYIATIQRVRFRLEAAHRPGWFLYGDNERGMCLSAKAKERRLIEMEVEKRYGDTSDGK